MADKGFFVFQESRAVIEAADSIAKDEMVSRADVGRRALREYIRQHGRGRLPVAGGEVAA